MQEQQAKDKERERERECVLKRDSMRACLSVCALLEAQFMQTSLAAVFALHFLPSLYFLLL